MACPPSHTYQAVQTSPLYELTYRTPSHAAHSCRNHMPFPFPIPSLAPLLSHATRLPPHNCPPALLAVTTPRAARQHACKPAFGSMACQHAYRHSLPYANCSRPTPHRLCNCLPPCHGVIPLHSAPCPALRMLRIRIQSVGTSSVTSPCVIFVPFTPRVHCTVL